MRREGTGKGVADVEYDERTGIGNMLAADDAHGVEILWTPYALLD